jgi:hypothetical protein
MNSKGDTSDEEPNMKELLSLGVVFLFIGMTAMTLSGGQHRGGNEGIRGRFVGAWRLAWLEEEGAESRRHPLKSRWGQRNFCAERQVPSPARAMGIGSVGDCTA